MSTHTTSYDIDLVYLWVDGSDPVWMAKRDACIGKPKEGSGANCKGRFADNDELKYSLRSVERYAPWIHRIYIVTDRQTPRWLDTSNPKIRIVDHTEILPLEARPCFNSGVLEHHLPNIPGLAEHFLFANDDMCLNGPVTPATFYGEDGLPIIRFNFRPFRRLGLWIEKHILGKTSREYRYRMRVQNAARLVKEKYGIYYGGKTHHNIDAYLKSGYRHAYEVFKEQIDATRTNHVRQVNDIQRNLYSYVALAERRAHLTYVTRRTSFRLHIHKAKLYDTFKKYNPTFLCMNDSEQATDADRRRSAAFLAHLFPEKSHFEK